MDSRGQLIKPTKHRAFARDALLRKHDADIAAFKIQQRNRRRNKILEFSSIFLISIIVNQTETTTLQKIILTIVPSLGILSIFDNDNVQ
jgi:hypothetical protein